MKLFKKVSALISASAVTGLVVFAGAVGVANAAPVTLVIEPEYLAPGEQAVLTIDGCSVGATLTLSVNGEQVQTGPVGAGSMPVEIVIGEGLEYVETGATNEFSATCTPGEGSDEAATSASDSITLFGSSYVEAIPETFYAGDTISITAGDFLPGAAVKLDVVTKKSKDVVYTKGLGTAKADFSVTGDVAFPKDLKCGEYDVVITGGAYSASAGLYICGKPTTTPSPSATTSPSTSPSVSPSASSQPSSTTSPTRPVSPGLPATGN